MTMNEIAEATCHREPLFHLLPPLSPELLPFMRGLLQKRMEVRLTPSRALVDKWLAASRSREENLVTECASPRTRHPFATDGITAAVIGDYWDEASMSSWLHCGNMEP